MANNGKEGERLFAQRAKESGYSVVDVSDNPDYWSKDIDFLLTSPTTGATKSFEVKWDARINQTGNLYLELTNVHSKQWNREGWWKHCQADILVYGDAVARKFYLIPMDKLRERVQTLPHRIVNCGTDSTGLLVSLRDISDIIFLL